MALTSCNSKKNRRESRVTELTRRELLALSALGLVASAVEPAEAAGPTGQLVWGVHTTLAPTWFDPAETPGFITPYMILYALHDATVKPMPGASFGTLSG